MVRSGRGFDGGQGDFADFLRRELHAAADQVEPGSDGLERIRDKIRSRPAHASQPNWILGVWLGISGVAARLIRRLGFRVPQRQAPERREPRRPRDWREAMLRPAFAVGAAVFAVGVVLSVVPPARQAMINVGDAIGSALNISSPSSSASTATSSVSPAPSVAENAPSSNSAAAGQSSLSACPSPSTHASATPTKSNSPSSTTATTVMSAHSTRVAPNSTRTDPSA